MTPRSPMENVGPEHFGQARAAFEGALECPPGARAAFLEDACRGDATLRSAVEDMLRADSSPHALLDGSATGPADRWRPGDTVAGHFRDLVAGSGAAGWGGLPRPRRDSGRDVA